MDLDALDRRGTEEQLVAYTIVDTCIGCTACTKRCPTNAITGTRNVVHVIDARLCIDCGACGVVCPPEAILVDLGYICKTFPRKEWPKAIVVEDNCIGRAAALSRSACSRVVASEPNARFGDFFGIAVLNEALHRLPPANSCGWGLFIDPPRELLKAWPGEEEAEQKKLAPVGV
jgi:ferredoxin